jgi:intracellular septation protein
MKSLILDTGAGLLFLAVLLMSHSVAAAVLAAAAASLALVGWLVASRQPVAPLQWLSLVLVIGLGGVSLVTHDPRFVMIKPSLVQAAIGVALLQPGWMRRYLNARQLAAIPPGAVVATGYAYAVLLFALAAANLGVALVAGPVAWAAYSSAVPLAAFGVMGAGVYLNFRRLANRSRALALPA